MSESTSWTPGVAAAYYNEDYPGVPGVAAAYYNEDYPGVPGVAAAYYNEDYPGVPGVAAAYYNEDYPGVPGVAAAYNEDYLSAPGVRFVPTDQELIVDYLERKLRGESLPTGVVHDGHNAYAEHPKKLVPKLGEGIEGSWYLFSPRQRKYAGGMRPKRAMGDDEGHWKATGAEKPVLGGTDGKEVIGTRRALTFHEDTYEVGSHGRRRRAKNKSASKPSKWKMVEFVCSNSCRLPGNDTALDPMLLNDFVLCKITNKSLSVEGDEEEQPTPDGGGGEPYEKHLPEQQQAGGGGAGTQAGQQQQGPSGGGAASHGGNQQPAPAEAPPPDYGHDLCRIIDVDCDVNWFTDANMLPMLMAYGGGRESLEVQTAGQQQASSGGGAGSANELQKPPGLFSP